MQPARPGSDFYVRVRPPTDAAAGSPEALVAAAKAAVLGSPDELASRSASKLFFTAPEALVAGAPAVLYFNRARSHPLRSNPNVKVRGGQGAAPAAPAHLPRRRPSKPVC